MINIEETDDDPRKGNVCILRLNNGKGIIFDIFRGEKSINQNFSEKNAIEIRDALIKLFPLEEINSKEYKIVENITYNRTTYIVKEEKTFKGFEWIASFNNREDAKEFISKKQC